MTPYPEYKATNLPWLPQIPAHWDTLKVKYAFAERSEKGFPNEQLLAATQTHGVIPKSIYETRTVEAQKDLHLLKLVKVGDFVISLRSFQGGIEYAYYQGIISPAYTIMIPNNAHIISTYFKYLAKSKPFVKLLQTCVTGIREGQNIDYNTFKRNSIPIPSVAEQEQIVRYLDSMTAKINKLIRTKKKQIALLQEQKQAIINLAVTKGLNPNAEMKDSGIDWLGQIPAHWEVKHLGHFSSLQNGISASADYFGSGYPFLNYGDVYSNYEIKEPLSGLANSTVKEQERYSIQNGDVFFTRTSETIDEIAFSSVCLKSIPHATFAGFLIRVRPNKGIILPLFSKYYFRNTVLRNYFVKEMNLVTRASLSQQLLRALPVVLPSLKEQEDIAQFLERKNKCFDTAITIIENEIAVISEYKNSLIASVVTGQVDVRNIQVEDFDPADLITETDDDPAEDDDQPQEESEE